MGCGFCVRDLRGGDVADKLRRLVGDPGVRASAATARQRILAETNGVDAAVAVLQEHAFPTAKSRRAREAFVDRPATARRCAMFAVVAVALAWCVSVPLLRRAALTDPCSIKGTLTLISLVCPENLFFPPLKLTQRTPPPCLPAPSKTTTPSATAWTTTTAKGSNGPGTGTTTPACTRALSTILSSSVAGGRWWSSPRRLLRPG